MNSLLGVQGRGRIGNGGNKTDWNGRGGVKERVAVELNRDKAQTEEVGIAQEETTDQE